MVELSAAVGKTNSKSGMKRSVFPPDPRRKKSKAKASANLKQELKRTAAVYGQYFVSAEIETTNGNAKFLAIEEQFYDSEATRTYGTLKQIINAKSPFDILYDESIT